MFVIRVTASGDNGPVAFYYLGRVTGFAAWATDPHDARVARYDGPSGDVAILCAAGYQAELVRLP